MSDIVGRIAESYNVPIKLIVDESKEKQYKEWGKMNQCMLNGIRTAFVVPNKYLLGSKEHKKRQ